MGSILEKQIMIEGLRVRYLCSNSFNESVVVFLHGWQSEAMHLKKIFENLDNYIAIDLPGFGGSDIPLKAWYLEDYAQFLKIFLRKMGLNKVILVGHSFGGSVIIKFIVKGGLAQKIILIASAGVRKKSFMIKFCRILAEVFKRILNLPIAIMFRRRARNFFYKLIGSDDYLKSGNLIEIYKNIIDEDLSGDIKLVKVPTFLIWGDNDKSTPLSDGYKIKSYIDNSVLHIIDGAGHFPFLDNETKFNKVFKSLLC